MIPAPDLQIPNEELLAAQAIARTAGALDADLIDSYIAKLEELKTLVEAGNLVPVCPELTNANPGSAHTVLLEAFAWMLAQIGYRINQVPDQNVIAFANLFGIELRAASRAETILRFTTTSAVADVIVPAGTEVQTESGIAFETVSQLTIPFGTPTGEVTGRAMAAGNTLLAPNKLTRLIDNVAFIGAVTNPKAVDSGSETESVESALERMRQYQQRAERLVSAEDLENAIYTEAMQSSGVIRVFPFVYNGDFESEPKPGYVTVIVMTKNGEPIDSLVKQKIGVLLNEVVGNLFVYVVDPIFVNFNVSVKVKLTTGSQQSAVLAAVEANLRAFYAASKANFGRPILRSEIIAVIEGTTGVDRIEAEASGAILASPLIDTKTKVWEMPKLVTVSITVV